MPVDGSTAIEAAHTPFGIGIVVTEWEEKKTPTRSTTVPAETQMAPAPTAVDVGVPGTPMGAPMTFCVVSNAVRVAPAGSNRNTVPGSDRTCWSHATGWGSANVLARRVAGS